MHLLRPGTKTRTRKLERVEVKKHTVASKRKLQNYDIMEVEYKNLQEHGQQLEMTASGMSQFLEQQERAFQKQQLPRSERQLFSAR